MGTQIIIILICLGGFLIIYPYLALSKIWQLLEKIEKHNKSINDKLFEMIQKEVE